MNFEDRQQAHLIIWPGLIEAAKSAGEAKILFAKIFIKI